MNIVLDNATVEFGKKKALDGVSVNFEEGKVYVILGPNGCGKSTLVKEIIARNNLDNEISYVAQESLGNIALTTYDYVALGRYNRNKFWGGLTKKDKELVADAIKKMGLEEMTDNIFDTLSGGEKQRAMIARAIAQDANWFIMDEPTSSLDAKHVKLMTTVIKELRAQGKSVIVVLHDLNMVPVIADEIILMKEGRIIDKSTSLSGELLNRVYDTEFVETEIDGRSFFILKD